MKPICDKENCNNKITARGMCHKHYYAARRRGEFGVLFCLEDGCEKVSMSRGLCDMHYAQKARSGEITKKICYGPDCDRGATNNGLCGTHALQSKTWGKLKTIREHGQWSNWYTNKHGYVVRRRTIDGKRVTQRQHRHVMENHLGRELIAGEEVHHINGVRDDNRIENLELWSTRQPKGQRIEDKTAWAKEWLSIYEPESLA